MRHQPGVECARLAAGEPEQQVEIAFSESLRPVDPLIAEDEVTLVGVGAGKGSLRRQGVQKRLGLGLGALPGRRPIMLEQHPARALLDAGRHAPTTGYSRPPAPAAPARRRTPPPPDATRDAESPPRSARPPTPAGSHRSGRSCPPRRRTNRRSPPGRAADRTPVRA